MAEDSVTGALSRMETLEVEAMEAQPQEETNDADKMPPPPVRNNPIEVANVIILVAYIINAFITYSSILGWYGETNTVVSRRYQTLITPKGTAFSIWGLIFIWEGIFAVGQIFPRFRGSPLVPTIAVWWTGTCIFQVLWSIAFAQERILRSVLYMFGILLSLLGLMWRADTFICDTTIGEYWLLRAPFSVHAGWILAASAVNANVLADRLQADIPTLLCLAIVSLAVILATATLYAVAYPAPDIILCLVVAWALFWVAEELKDPKLLLDPTKHNPREWDEATIRGVRYSAEVLCRVALGLAALAVVVRCGRACARSCARRRAAAADAEKAAASQAAREAATPLVPDGEWATA